MSEYTEGKFQVLEYYSVWCEDTQKFEDVCLIFKEIGNKEIIEIARTNPILEHDQQLANAAELVRRWNAHEELVKALEGMKWLYDQRALGPLGAAAKYGPNYDEQCLEIREMAEAALAQAQSSTSVQPDK